MKNNVTMRRQLVDGFAVVRPKTGYILIAAWLVLVAFVWSCKKTPEPEPNKPPVPKVATTNTTGTLGGTLVLDGSGSSDPEGKALTYKWTIKSQPPGSTATITNATSAVAGLVPDKPGTYVLVLTVTDVSGSFTSIEVTITVAIPGKPPVVNAGVSSTVTTGRKVTLDGSKTTDPDGDRLTYLWTVKSKPTGSAVTISNATNAIADFTPDLLGTYIFTLSATDGNWPTVSADVTVTVAVPVVKEITGKWSDADGTSGANDYTPRNRFYSFEVSSDNQLISLTLTSSDINVGLALYNPLGNLLNYRQYDRAIVIDQIVNAGTYSVMAYTGQRYDKGSFKLVGKGLGSEFSQRVDKRLTATDVSFGTEGGGGTEYTPRNHYYTFDVTSDNATVDINAQSATSGLWLSLFGSSGAQIADTYVGTPRYLIRKLNKGTYGLWVGSGDRNAVAKYTLDLFGQVQNLKQSVFDFATLADTYRGKNAATLYTLTVTEDNTILDVSLSSPNVAGNLTIVNPNGVNVGDTYNGNYRYLIKATNKGQYKIQVAPDGSSSGIGNYTLSVYGKFTDLKKQ